MTSFQYALQNCAQCAAVISSSAFFLFPSFYLMCVIISFIKTCTLSYHLSLHVFVAMVNRWIGESVRSRCSSCCYRMKWSVGRPFFLLLISFSLKGICSCQLAVSIRYLCNGSSCCCVHSTAFIYRFRLDFFSFYFQPFFLGGYSAKRSVNVAVKETPNQLHTVQSAAVIDGGSDDGTIIHHVYA